MRPFRHAVRLSLFAVLVGAVSMPLQVSAQVAAKAPLKQGKQVKRYTIEQFMATTSVTGASFSKDERQILFSSNASGIFNAYTLPVGGGTPRALTTSTGDSTYAVGYFYNDDRILFTRDTGGDEQNHLYVFMPPPTSAIRSSSTSTCTTRAATTARWCTRTTAA
jgi:Tol biopolymer transport system component